MSPENEQYDDAGLPDLPASGPVIAKRLKTKPCCSRCLNHGLKISINGHKRYCQHRLCTCQKCVFTAERQRVMARQAALRRAEALDETRIIEVHEAVAELSVNSETNHLQQQVISSTNSQPLTRLNDDSNIIQNNLHQTDNQGSISNSSTNSQSLPCLNDLNINQNNHHTTEHQDNVSTDNTGECFNGK